MSVFVVFCLFALTAFSCVSAAPKEVPKYIHICKRNDPQVEKCITESVENLKPKLAKGIPDLDVPGLEPLIIPEIIVGSGGDSSQFRAVGRNVKVHGASNFKILKMKADIPTFTFYITIALPKLDFEADYDVDFRVLVVPIKGKGPLTFNATDIIADCVLKGEIITTKKGNKHMVFPRMDLDIKLKNFEIHLQNLFGGDSIIGEATNQALNENKEEFYNVLKPNIEKQTAAVLLEIANKITKNFEIDKVFPES